MLLFTAEQKTQEASGKQLRQAHAQLEVSAAIAQGW